MKSKISIYFFVALYMIAMLRPIAPFVEYAINYDYISKVLCINKDKPELECNGKCQLMKKLEKQQEEDYKLLRITIEDYPIGFVSVLNLDLRTKLCFKEKETFYYNKNYYYLRNTEIFHPPTV